ncbi:cryptochrome/photolyase family protein [Candidatus Vallotia cooleyia]|uniref:cryptochrome/photolyase family protein n=1 Tax=Candidatus Vallotiella adelgis TaxID=1177211 RepID=UPI001EF094FC|nr:deoxyribodipyrimidine photo-lyase [Candidatus Vallotia cooleyia]
MWFRDDQRLTDNPALEYAITTGHPIVCIYIHDLEPQNIRPSGLAVRWWLHQSLNALHVALAALGGELTVLHGSELQTIAAFATEIGAIKVCWNRRYSVSQRATDAEIEMILSAHNIATFTFNGHLLREPWDVTTQDGPPFRIFSAYWRAARHKYSPPTPRPKPQRIDFFPVSENIAVIARSKNLSQSVLQPFRPKWAGGLNETWQCGEQAGWIQLDDFLANTLTYYGRRRDIPAMQSTSRLSPYLRFGNLSVRQVWHAILSRMHDARLCYGNEQISPTASGSVDKFLNELGWREFAYYLLYHYAPLHQVNLKRQFDAMPWRADSGDLCAWQQGCTGYPIIDAGMRELWHTGWMHNRVRMVTASFLVKHLLIDWREGEAWFWDTLVDADEASNPANWQWVAGSGADAVPYFRIFNPILQGKKFDPQGSYVRRWVPELMPLPSECIHTPWLAQPKQLANTTLILENQEYPLPLVSHPYARERALKAIEYIRRCKIENSNSLS